MAAAAIILQWFSIKRISGIIMVLTELSASSIQTQSLKKLFILLDAFLNKGFKFTDQKQYKQLQKVSEILGVKNRQAKDYYVTLYLLINKIIEHQDDIS